MKTIEYKGVTVEYDEKVLTKWKWQRAVTSGDASRIFDAFDELLVGKSDEVADAIGGEVADMQDLIIELMGAGEAKAKN